MFGISFAELAVIFLLILVVMGPEKIPEVARWAGRGMRELRQASNALRDALMIDELTGQKRLPEQNARAHSNHTPQAPTAPQPEPSPPKTTPQAQSSPRPGLTGIDQMDPEDFDRFLEEQYQLHHKELRSVPLAIQKESSHLRSIPLSAALASSDDARQSVPLSPSLAHELAS